jgi:hypothetical protein
VKFGKMILTASMVLAPTLAWGIAQQDPNTTSTQHQLRQDQSSTSSSTMPSSQSSTYSSTASKDVVGTIVEVRDDSFSVRKDADQSVVWFTITPDLKQSASSELVTGNHVRVTPQAGASGDRMAASSIKAEAGGSATASTSTSSTMPNRDRDTDLNADLNADKNSASASASVNRNTTSSTTTTDTTIAQNDTNKNLRNDNDTYKTGTDRDQLPKTASSLPEIGLLGLLAVVGAAAVAIVRKF